MSLFRSFDINHVVNYLVFVCNKNFNKITHLKLKKRYAYSIQYN